MLLVVVLLFICILLYILFIINYFLGDHSKKSKVVILTIPLAIVLGFLVWQFSVSNHYFIRSSDLSKETVVGMQLDELTTVKQLNQVGEYERNIQPDGFMYDYGDLMIKTDTSHRITSFSTNWGLNELEEGDSLNKVKAIYGDHYYTYKEMGLGKAYVFVDRELDWVLTVWTQEEKVRYVWISTM